MSRDVGSAREVVGMLGHSENLPVSRPNFPIGIAFSEPCYRCGGVCRVVALREADGLICADCATAILEEEATEP